MAVEVDDFTDAVDSRVSVGDASHLTGGLGVVAEVARNRNRRGDSLSLRGSSRTRLLLGLGGSYQRGRLTIDAEVSAGGFGSDDAQYTGRVTFGLRL